MHTLSALSHRKKTLVRNLPFYLAGAMVVFGIKSFYSHAGACDLLWILAPTTRLVTLLSGIPFAYVPGAGYANHGLRILIAPSCSGVRFLTILFAALFFPFVHRLEMAGRSRLSSIRTTGTKYGYLTACLLFAYVCTLLTNSLRIVLSLFLPRYLGRTGLLDGALTPDRLHSLTGVFCYFLSLLLLYRLADTAFRKRTDIRSSTSPTVPRQSKKALAQLARACLPPLFWYFLLTLGIPLLGQAYVRDPRAFGEYVLLLVTGCSLVLLPCLMVTFAGSVFRKGPR